jgi:hypothetical protein
MQSSPARPAWLRHWRLLLGLLLIGAGLLGVYSQLRAKARSVPAQIATGLLCRIYPVTSPPTEAKKSHTSPSNTNPSAVPQTTEPDSLTGATLKLSGAPEASVDETVVVSLCVESKPGLPEQRREALKDHLLVQLSAIGLQVDPREKIPTTVSSAECLGTAEWTVRANAPGRYSAVLVPDTTDDQPNRTAAAPSKPRWDFDLEQPARLDIQFQDPWSSSIQRMWGLISTLLGTVLVITQILLNLRQRKKAQTA